MPKRFVVDAEWRIADNYSCSRASLVAPQEGNLKTQSFPCMAFFSNLSPELYQEPLQSMEGGGPAAALQDGAAGSSGEEGEEEGSDIGASDSEHSCDPPHAPCGPLRAIADGQLALEGGASSARVREQRAGAPPSELGVEGGASAETASPGKRISEKRSAVGSGASPAHSPVMQRTPAAKVARQSATPKASPPPKLEGRPPRTAEALAAAIDRMKSRQAS